MLGYIEIKKTDIKYPILESATSKALEVAVAVAYPTTNVKLNQPGNIIIHGHNYRNNQFFSNNDKLKIGDTIYITDEQGNKIIYSIYEIFSTTPEDTTFYNRDTKGLPEITLSTCSDDGKTRLIIKAKAEK
jgi:LPXTG-site transpeptidase (sortase) family protein